MNAAKITRQSKSNLALARFDLLLRVIFAAFMCFRSEELDQILGFGIEGTHECREDYSPEQIESRTCEIRFALASNLRGIHVCLRFRILIFDPALQIGNT